jgi:hypothetical protein
VGTAVIGSIVTKGYAEELRDNAPPQAPQRLVSALENPQALVSEGAREALTRAASAFPGGEQLVRQVIQVAREALSDSIHDGFVFVLFAVGCAIGAALLMKNIRLEEVRPVEPEQRGAPASDTAFVPDLAVALRRDAKGSGDEAYASLLDSIGAAIALSGLADRIESSNGRYPNLLRAAAGLANGRGGDEHERAVYASKNIIRPLADSFRK